MELDADKDRPIMVIYQYALPDHVHDLRLVQCADDMYELLTEIDNRCRSYLKYGQDDLTLDSFCEELRQDIRSVISTVEES